MNLSMKALNDVVLDYSNPQKNYSLAKEYDRLEQGAGAFSFYLRAADMSEGKTWDDRWLQYKAMILSSFIFDRSYNRDHTTDGLLKMAIEIMPERPEAYYFLSKFKQTKNDWRESMMYAQIGISNIDSRAIEPAPDNDISYPGNIALRILYARAKWKTDGRDTSKNLAFDLKYKFKLNAEEDKEVTELLNSHGYPSTLEYTSELFNSFKYEFKGLLDIENNYSRHFQDMFVLSCLNGKKNGTFVEVGSGHPTLFNNTKLLEDQFDWKGISIDNSERFCAQFSRERNTSVLLADAAAIDYKMLFKQHCLEQRIDFLRINSETSSLEVLKKIPFSDHEFTVVQFQHNACWWGPQYKEESRKILSDIGYILIVPDVAVNEKDAYEDWWVHPNIANKYSHMASKKKINFAWDYMMEKL
jgi:hypothetical protein